MSKKIHLPAEWEPQSGILLAWPHRDTDWRPYLDEAIRCFDNIAANIERFEPVIAVPRDIPTNDTWARDFGPISVFIDGKPCLFDFTFNGWGQKFPADLDNAINKKLYDKGIFAPEVEYRKINTVLEGGSIESDGQGTLLTTSQCLLAPRRNGFESKSEAEKCLKSIFALDRILFLDHGALEGDDTDSHIDTLARFCSADTIAYVKCNNENDRHFKELALMEQELREFRTANNQPYKLIALPMAEPAFYGNERLPATYANFLIINGAVLFPEYGARLDKVACAQLQKAFPDREIIGVNCLPLIRQHGSLHCVSMQLPKSFVK
jgi:agmatine/peptidylarginine deiminase